MEGRDDLRDEADLRPTEGALRGLLHGAYEGCMAASVSTLLRLQKYEKKSEPINASTHSILALIEKKVKKNLKKGRELDPKHFSAKERAL